MRFNVRMWRKLRIAVLLYVLLFVALGAWLTERELTDWQEPLWIRVHPIPVVPAADAYVETLTSERFAPLEAWLAKEARRHGVRLDRPVRFELAPALDALPPELPAEASALDAAIWSLGMRWWSWRQTRGIDGPEPDLEIFALYYPAAEALVLDRSLAIEKAQIAVVRLFAAPSAAETNLFVLAHELLHLVGATDKYDPATLMPVWPEGWAEPDRRPRFPQRYAELMGGRIPVAPDRAEIPPSLDRAIVGPLTAAEIGWTAGLKAE